MSNRPDKTPAAGAPEPAPPRPGLLLLEINEFNPELMAAIARQESLPHLQRLLALPASRTSTPDTEERFGLDPWVQWASIHTGVASSEHGCRHLGSPPARHAQVWEVLDRQGLRTGVWGAMNASRGQCRHQAFFFPDPWTFNEQPFPAGLTGLLRLPRYYAQHYGHTRPWPLLRALLALLAFCLRPRHLLVLLPMLPRLLYTACRYGLRHHILFALFDWVNARLFLHYWRRSKPDFSILFLNSLAHLQHNRWRRRGPHAPDFLICFRIMDRIAGLLLNALGDNALLIANAFSQTNCEAEHAMLYRQQNPTAFLAAAGLRAIRVEQMMTNDAHVFFDSAQDRAAALQALSDARVNGKPVFQAEPNTSPEGEYSLFYQVVLWDALPKNSVLAVNGRNLDFFAHFKPLVQRTGAHVSEGLVLARGLDLPTHLPNHDLFGHIVQYFCGNRTLPGNRPCLHGPCDI